MQGNKSTISKQACDILTPNIPQHTIISEWRHEQNNKCSMADGRRGQVRDGHKLPGFPLGLLALGQLTIS